jgi:DNA-binding response OmpR family regulator
MDGEQAGKLLLVEDENLLRGLIAQFLRAEGFEVVEAADGSEGVEFFASAGPFDVVLLDLNLPVLSGVDVCRRIKGMNPLQPVIICSAAILDSHAEALRELTVDQFLNKPYHPLELLNRIAVELGRKSGAPPNLRLRPLKSPHWKVDRPEADPACTQSLVKSPQLD